MICFGLYVVFFVWLCLVLLCGVWVICFLCDGDVFCDLVEWL